MKHLKTISTVLLISAIAMSSTPSLADERDDNHKMALRLKATAITATNVGGSKHGDTKDVFLAVIDVLRSYASASREAHIGAIRYAAAMVSWLCDSSPSEACHVAQRSLVAIHTAEIAWDDFLEAGSTISEEVIEPAMVEIMKLYHRLD